MKPIDIIRENLESCFMFCSYAAFEIRQKLGVLHLSQVWTELPSWYFWLNEPAGAFMLELRGSTDFMLSGNSCNGTVGVVRYFPPDTSVELGDDEVALLTDVTFDSTGTPSFEKLDRIAGTELFVIGRLELHVIGEAESLLFVFEPTRLDSLSNVASASFFKHLVGMYAYAHQANPEGPYMWGENVVAAVFDNNGNGKLLLEAYLGAGQNVAVANDMQMHTFWSELSKQKPASSENAGCCCCC